MEKDETKASNGKIRSESGDNFDDVEDGIDDSPVRQSGGAPPALQERNPLEFGIIIVGATALAFNAGFINGCTIQFRNITVSHVTGTSTHIGINIANADWENFSLTLCLLMCFIFGAGITGILVPTRSFRLGVVYGPIFLIGSFLLMLACLTAHYFPSSNWYFYFAAMASGLQNALTTKYSGSVIRTTHVTGTATDIGLAMGKLIIGNTTDCWKLKLLCPLLIAFISGGAVSVLAFRKMGNLAIAINIVVFFGVGLCYSILVGSRMNIPIWQAFLGTYKVVGRSVKQAVDTSAKTLQRAVSPLTMQENDYRSVRNPMQQDKRGLV